jgi:type III pantothenate kinase
MIIAVNIGNTRISIGFFEDCFPVLKHRFEISSVTDRTVDEYYSTICIIARELGVDMSAVNGGVVSSVVPRLTATVCKTVERFTGELPVVVGPGVKTGFPIKIDSPSELGGDMVANAASVIAKMREENDKRAAIIVDMSAVTTVSAINDRGEYVGCAILPGVQMSLEALRGNTALLPSVAYESQSKAIGKNSHESVLSGVMLGHALMLDGFVLRFANEMKTTLDKTRLFATGEYAMHIIPLCKNNFEYDGELILSGLYRIYEKSKENRS